MMHALIFIEHADGKVSDATIEMAVLAAGAGLTFKGVICASDASVIEELSTQLRVFEELIAITDVCLTDYNPASALIALETVVSSIAPDVVMLSYSTAGVDLGASLAVKTGREMVGYVSELTVNGDEISVASQIYGGKLIARTKISCPAVLAVMPGVAKPDAGAETGTAPVVHMMQVDLSATRIRVKEVMAPDTSDLDLTKSEKIFCVGRALGGAEKLEIAQAFAESLGADLAGSRPVIDAGWLPKVHQVGKSGTKVKPKLYLMAGVSGAPEHLEGMADSELIIALNSDEQAPIFNIAHFGAVCDMFEVMPALTKRLQGVS